MVVVAAVDHLADLVLQSGRELGVGMAQGVDGDTSQTIYVRLTVGIPDAQAFAMRQGHGQTSVGVHGVGRCGRDHGNSKIETTQRRLSR